jgi:hypothetical protein
MGRVGDSLIFLKKTFPFKKNLNLPPYEIQPAPALSIPYFTVCARCAIWCINGVVLAASQTGYPA